MSRGEFGSRQGPIRDLVPIAGSSFASSSSGRDGDSEYIRLNNKIKTNIQQISSNVAAIQRMDNQLGTVHDGAPLRQKLADVQTSTALLAKDASVSLQQLAKLDGGSESERQQRKMQQKRLTDNFSQVLSRFKTVEKSVVAKQKSFVEKARRTASFSAMDDDDESSDTTALMQRQQGGMAVQKLEGDVDLDLIREREDAIKNIEQTMTDVNQIFKDLSVMVYEQGDMIDNIESNVEEAHGDVRNANVQLASARDHQKKARKKKCCCLILCLIGVAVIAIIIVVAIKKK
ncbi:syntaxin-7-like [Oscarella lobularis]|uniref:syntaxin-7-like n=1 Tax=Oscarella lobularis TaxID=121494 RepID=UPI0033141071